MHISALITAAGHSKRMGFPKALLPSHNTFKALYLVESLYSVSLKTYVTLPQFLLRDHDITQQLSIYQAKLFANAYDELGFVGSIKTVLDYDTALTGLLIIPIDTEFCPSLMKYLINHIKNTRGHPALIAPYFYSVRGHPAYFSHHFFKSLIDSHHHGGPRTLFDFNEKYVHRLLWPDARILHNANHWHQTTMD